MKTRTIAVVVIALVLAGSPVTRVHAGTGGGGGESLDVPAFDCYLIAGAKPPHVLTLDDQFFTGDSQLTGVTLGPAQLVCTPAAVTVTSNQSVRAGLPADHLVCYVAPPQTPPPNVLKQVVDPLVAQTVRVGAPRYVCIGAVKCPVGQDCPAE
jgi:hypothetical protein